jgi:hypothetical protein
MNDKLKKENEIMFFKNFNIMIFHVTSSNNIVGYLFENNEEAEKEIENRNLHNNFKIGFVEKNEKNHLETILNNNLKINIIESNDDFLTAIIKLNDKKITYTFSSKHNVNSFVYTDENEKRLLTINDSLIFSKLNDKIEEKIHVNEDISEKSITSENLKFFSSILNPYLSDILNKSYEKVKKQF